MGLEGGKEEEGRILAQFHHRFLRVVNEISPDINASVSSSVMCHQIGVDQCALLRIPPSTFHVCHTYVPGPPWTRTIMPSTELGWCDQQQCILSGREVQVKGQMTPEVMRDHLSEPPASLPSGFDASQLVGPFPQACPPMEAFTHHPFRAHPCPRLPAHSNAITWGWLLCSL